MKAFRYSPSDTEPERDAEENDGRLYPRNGKAQTEKAAFSRRREQPSETTDAECVVEDGACDKKRIRACAYSFVSRCDYTPGMLYSKLCEKLPTAEKEEIKSVVRELMKEGFISESSFGERVIEICKARRYSAKKTEELLRSKKFSRTYIESHRDELLEGEEERAYAVMSKRLDVINESDGEKLRKQINGVYSYMLRQGFSSGTVSATLKRYNEEAGNADDIAD